MKDGAGVRALASAAFIARMSVGAPHLVLGEDHRRQLLIADIYFYLDLAIAPHSRANRDQVLSSPELEMRHLQPFVGPGDSPEGSDCYVAETFSERGAGRAGGQKPELHETAIDHLLLLARNALRASRPEMPAFQRSWSISHGRLYRDPVALGNRNLSVDHITPRPRSASRFQRSQP
jgi:hypothetical protein